MNAKLVQRLKEIADDNDVDVRTVSPNCFIIRLLSDDDDEANIVVEDIGYAFHVTVVAYEMVYPADKILRTVYSNVFPPTAFTTIVAEVERLIRDVHIDDDLSWIVPSVDTQCPISDVDEDEES